MSVSLPRHNYHQESEAALNRQINLELYASYTHMAMAAYFDRDNVALPGFKRFFEKKAAEERSHAEKLMKYQNKRGGRIVFQPIAKPEQDEWVNGLAAMEASLTLKKNLNKALLDLHSIGTRHADPQLCDYIESEFLNEHISSIKMFADHVAMLKRVGPGLGEYEFDQETLGGSE